MCRTGVKRRSLALQFAVCSSSQVDGVGGSGHESTVEHAKGDLDLAGASECAGQVRWVFHSSPLARASANRSVRLSARWE